MATVLTFDVNPPFTNFKDINQAYGDRVTSAAMPGNMLYGENGGFTPNVNVNYGPLISDPALWTTNFGNLTNVLFKDSDAQATLRVTLTADPGFTVSLHSWDMAAYDPNFTNSPRINAVRVLDSGGNSLLTLSDVVISEKTRTVFNYSANPFVDDVLVLEFDSINLGGNSDDICFDNIVFSQHALPEVVGDYNLNGTVEAADYVVWRKQLGMSGLTLAADGDADGKVTQDDYAVWRSNFGESVPSMSATGATVPEPGCFVLMLSFLGMSLSSMRRHVRILA